MDVHEEQAKKLDPAILALGADRFVRYGIAGLEAQGAEQIEAARAVLAAVQRWFREDFEREVEALLNRVYREEG